MISLHSSAVNSGVSVNRFTGSAARRRRGHHPGPFAFCAGGREIVAGGRGERRQPAVNIFPPHRRDGAHSFAGVAWNLKARVFVHFTVTESVCPLSTIVNPPGIGVATTPAGGLMIIF